MMLKQGVHFNHYVHKISVIIGCTHTHRVVIVIMGNVLGRVLRIGRLICCEVSDEWNH